MENCIGKLNVKGADHWSTKKFLHDPLEILLLQREFLYAASILLHLMLYLIFRGFEIVQDVQRLVLLELLVVFVHH